MATATLIPSAYTLSNTTYLTIADESNMYANTSSTTYGTCTHTRASTSYSYYLYLHNFNFGTVPDDAIVSSFSIKIKASATGQSTSSSYRMSLYNGSTSISNTTVTTSLSTTVTTFTFPNGSMTWATLKNYGNNFRIRIPLRRSNANTEAVVSVYGAEIEVTYTIPVYHSVTITNPTAATVTASDNNPLEGSDVDIIADTISGLTIKDNGVDVTSQFVNGLTETVAAVPGSYQTGGSINGTNYQSTIGKGSDTANRTGNDYFSTTQGASGSTWIDYYFDFSSIPLNATIQSVTLTVKGHCESTSQSREISRVQAYSGTTEKGSYTDMTDSTTDKVYTVDVGTWTATELHSAKLRHTIGVYGGLVSGATWTVVYEVDGYVYTISNIVADHAIVVSSGGVTQTMYFKANGSYVAGTKVWKKVNGSWVQQANLTQVFDNNVNYTFEE